MHKRCKFQLLLVLGSLDVQYMQLTALFLEGAIKGNVFCFTDDKAKRHKINQTLSKIAGFVANLYKTTRGRAKGALDGKVRKFHIFEEQIKSSQEIQSEMMRLQREADEWKRKYKDIEQENKDLWQQMTQIINERDKLSATCKIQTRNLKTMWQL